MGGEMAAKDYQYDENTLKVKINCLGYLYGASVEDFDEAMARVMDVLLEVKKVESIILVKEREYEYGHEQTAMLLEVARVLEQILREGIAQRREVFSPSCSRYLGTWSKRIQYIVFELMRKDPIGAYVSTVRAMREINLKAARAVSAAEKKCYLNCSNRALKVIKEGLEKTKLIQAVKGKLAGYHMGNRDLYRGIFSPTIRPNFMLTRYVVIPPKGGRSIDRYKVGDSQVEIFRVPGETRYIYHIIPPEFRLSEEKYTVLDAARKYMAAHRPKRPEFVKSKRIREVFYNIGKDTIRETADSAGIHLTSKETEQLATILTRYTAGLGVLEVLLADEKIQDLYVNSPIEKQPILIYHQNFEECKTNLIPTMEDAEAWATRMRIESGRPLDEANPVLDFNINVPGGSARFAIITKSLSPHGLGFAIRRHREKPWTLPLFIKNKMLTPLAAGLLSFLIEGSVSMLVAGGRSSGKTSLLGSLLLEIMPKVRILSIEDSVTGDSGIIYQNSGEIKRSTVGGLIDGLIEKHGKKDCFGRDVLDRNPKNVKVYAANKQGKIFLAPVSKFIRHKVNKRVYEVKTSTGREIKVTEDHSLFRLGKNIIEPVKAKELIIGDFIAAPRVLPLNNKDAKPVNLLKHLDKIDKSYIVGNGIRELIEKNRETVKRRAKKIGYSKITVGAWKRNNILPGKVIKPLLKSCTELNSNEFKIKSGKHSRPIPLQVEMDSDFLCFVGLWLADGCYDKCSVIISVVEEENREIVRRVARRFGVNCKMHSDGFSLMINSKSLKNVMKDVLGLEGNSYTKKVPSWSFRLSKKQIGFVLKGLFSGDGCASDKEITMALASKRLIRDVQTLLLHFGIIMRVNKLRTDKTRHCNISALKSLKLFKDNVGFLTKKKIDRLNVLCSKKSTHDSSDVIPLPLETKMRLTEVCKIFSKGDYVKRNNNIGREHLKKIIRALPENEKILCKELELLANSDIYWDKIVDIKSFKKPQHVYDFSVPGCENFICDNVLAHNTLELPIESLRDLNYNIERLKSRSVITRVETEMPADEALRTALRLGDSAMIVGEIRSTEAKALFEAMRIGALSNIVAGTIHGESAYGVFDRVVNDLEVPKTSFKATDIIPICKMLRSSDGLHRFRRITEITEVRKEWSEDPVKEGGFVNLMEYSGKGDMLKPTDTLLNGESEVINRIASYVREWSGNWAGVWENINLRAKMKAEILRLSEQLKNPELIEAPWVVRGNQEFHLLEEKVREELGTADPSRVWEEWKKWLTMEAIGKRPRGRINPHSR